jgi:hypothetical protein
MRYQTLRSVSDNHVFVVCRDGAFYELVPVEVQHQGPWQGMHRGEIGNLNSLQEEKCRSFPVKRAPKHRNGVGTVGPISAFKHRSLLQSGLVVEAAGLEQPLAPEGR